jgi:glycosyltransferase involved in cell wall biosynthesis
MKSRVLLVSPANPYPTVTNGCARLVLDYVQSVFAEEDVSYLSVEPQTWTPRHLYRDHRQIGPVTSGFLLNAGFSLVFFVGFRSTPFTRSLVANLPAFCLTDTLPHPDIPEGIFRGILSHRAPEPREDLLICGGSYDSAVYFKNRQSEDLVTCVGRIHPDKGQLELVQGYREQVYERFHRPLLLVGGSDDRAYFEAVRAHIDGVAVRSTLGTAPDGWLAPPRIADVLNRARCYVSASPRESFGIALAEALACGTTCVLNGHYAGFVPAELQRHVYGNVTGKRGSTLDLLAEVLEQDVRLDGSEWVRMFSVEAAARRQRAFIRRRLETFRE